MTPLIELRDVRKVYNHQDAVALDSVSLTIPAGQAASRRSSTCSAASTALPRGRSWSRARTFAS